MIATKAQYGKEHILYDSNSWLLNLILEIMNPA